MPLAARLAGAALVVAGLPVLLHAFAPFVTEGRGTPAPVAPTERLVVGGLCRWVRNPMYLAVGAVIAGQPLLLGSPAAAYLVLFAVAVVSFVRGYEEPALRARHGPEYDEYHRRVPGWWPRPPRP